MAASLSIASDLACALDPVHLTYQLGMEPDPWQARLLRSESKQMILNCSRQVGKSTVSSVIALHTALYMPASLILVLSPSLRQSQELFRKVKESFRALPSPLSGSEESALRLEFSNGSRLVCLPGKEATIRGFSGVRLLIVDEASRVPDELYYAVRPMLAVSGGRIALLSTPFGKRGFFHQVWTEGGADWLRIEVTAYDCPRIAKEWLDAERDAIGAYWFEQEYLCQFKDTIDQVFSYEDVKRAVSDEAVKPLFG